MIEKVTVEYFKKFQKETFYLGDSVVLAGPNNSGKTTLLQAIAVWYLAIQRWRQERGSNKSKAALRTGFPISRKDFTAIPLREMNLLWTDRSTAYSRDKARNIEPGQPKLVKIGVEGKVPDGSTWQLNVAIRYSSREQIYVKLLDQEGKPLTELPPSVSGTQVVHVPPFSGIGAEETRYDRGYQNYLIGQEKPGEILRNLLLEIFQGSREDWDQLKQEIRELFGCEILDPSYSSSDPFIIIEYNNTLKTQKIRSSLEIPSAGSGFNQVLTLFGFIYAREASILLIDEPDAHEHVILQRQVYERLRSVARHRNCQLIISSHSEIVLEDTTPQQILSFYGKPHRIKLDEERDRVREALRRLSSLDILSGESRHNILYLESESDFNILKAFAKVLKHEAMSFFNKPFYYPLRGSNPREAKAHFFGLQAISPQIRGILFLDRDNKDFPDHEIAADNLRIVRWKRYEIENYLLVPNALVRYVKSMTSIRGEMIEQPDLFQQKRIEQAEAVLRDQFPPDAWANPLGENPFLLRIAASKELLPKLFDKVNISIPKKDYYQIAESFGSAEVHPEVKANLDLIAEILPSVPDADDHT